MANALPPLSLLPAMAIAALAALTPPVALAGSAGADRGLNTEELKRLVHQDCGSCHGLTLKGGLGPDIRPENLTHYDPDILEMLILDGIPDTAMPPWRPLITQEEAQWIALYLLNGDAQ
ncbi:cytochrome c55X [Aliiroseovarius crassostreae]|nr:cytochrome c [Aliiroseovarius crassostreae]SFU46778.1 cytochrome c55X [Aliiroseovarius crassostreae]